MPREELLAQVAALEWAAKTPWPEYIDLRTAILAKAEELRAQAEAMQNNGAAQDGNGVNEPKVRPSAMACQGTTSDAKSSGLPAAAPPSAAQTVAWMYQHEETGNVNFRPINERWVDHRRYVEIPLYAAPPDLAARVRELEGLLQETQQFGAFGVGSTLANRINAALAKGE